MTEEQEKLSIARSHKVVMHNNLVRSAKMSLQTHMARKIIAYTISKIKPEDKELRTYAFEIRDFCKECGIDYNNGANYLYIKDTLRALRDRSFMVEGVDDIGEYEDYISWFDRLKIYPKIGRVYMKFNEQLEPLLIQLKRDFTEYELFYILAMNSKYSHTLYELMKSYQSLRKYKPEIELLKAQLEAEKYSQWNDFKRYVLDPAVKDINKYTDLKISYKPMKEPGKGRRWAHIEFNIAEKSTAERLKAMSAVHEVIDPDQQSLFPKEDPVSKALRTDPEIKQWNDDVTKLTEGATDENN